MQKNDSDKNSRGLEYVVTQIVFSADGMYLAVADGDNAVYVYDIDRYGLIIYLLFFYVYVYDTYVYFLSISSSYTFDT
jgi:hypothetical protein